MAHDPKYICKQIENYMENILFNFQCDFRKVFNAQQCPLGMIEKAKGVMGKGGYFSVLPTDLEKAIDCLLHGLIMVNLYAFRFIKMVLFV